MEKQNDLPLISIGVSAYNRKDYLRLSLDSLLTQTYPNCEIIVVDDGSSDGTGEMMAAEYPQIRYIYQENAGDAAAKNHAAREAHGKYIVFNDSDDLFLPDTVERLYNALPENPGNACSYGTYQTIDAAGNSLPTKKKVTFYPSGMIVCDLLKHIVVNNCGTLIPRPLFLEAGGFDETLRVSYDYKFFLKIAGTTPFFAVQEPVFLRRRHGNNLSGATYAKLLIVLKVVEGFAAENPDSAEKYRTELHARYADLHNKLTRQARKEKLKKEALEHASAAFHYRPGLKSFFRLLGAKLGL